MATQSGKVPVSERALLVRINRKLAKDQLKLCKCRETSKGFESLGSYYLLDVYNNVVNDTHVDLESLGRKLNSIASHECITG